MKAILCLLVLVASACAVEEKKTEKRGVLGLGYGLGHAAPIIGHGGYGGYGGYGGFYGHGLGLYSGVGHAGLGYGHGLYGGGYYGNGLSSGVYGHGLLGHGGVVASAPVVSHAGLYGAPLLGLGHGWH